MDGIAISEKILKEVRLRQEELTEILKTGSVSDWNSYNKVIGELSGLSLIERIILDLRNKEIEE